jgi:hypothetical protein
MIRGFVRLRGLRVAIQEERPAEPFRPHQVHLLVASPPRIQDLLDPETQLDPVEQGG